MKIPTAVIRAAQVQKKTLLYRSGFLVELFSIAHLPVINRIYSPFSDSSPGLVYARAFVDKSTEYNTDETGCETRGQELQERRGDLAIDEM